jgi:hypothetical protein
MRLGGATAALSLLVAVAAYVAWVATVDEPVWKWVTGGVFWLALLAIVASGVAAVMRRRR